jgi:hypothetical protein
MVRSLEAFPDAVLTGLDAAGFPFSLRCTPQPDHRQQLLQAPIPPGIDILPGPAGLLCHRHNERLWGLKNFVLLGHLELQGTDWFFHPARFIPGNGFGGLLGDIRLIFKARATARRYLEKRGLTRPEIPWAAIKALQAEARGEKPQD